MLVVLLAGTAFLYFVTHDFAASAALTVGLGTLWICQYLLAYGAGWIARRLTRRLPPTRNAGIREPGYRLGQKKNLPDAQPATPALRDAATRRRVDDAYGRFVARMLELDRRYDLQRSSVSLEGSDRLVIRTPDRRVLSATATPVGAYDVRTSTWRWDGAFATDAQDRVARLLPADAHGSTDAAEVIARNTVQCSENDGWVFTALAAETCANDGGFRLVSGSSRLFVLVSGLRQVGTD